MRLALLVNPRARQGRGGGAAAAIVDRLTALGHSVRRIEPSSEAEVGPSLAAAIEDGIDRVLIAGGDGLVHRSLPALVSTTAGEHGVPVGLLPIGTGNDFARALGVPRRRTRAVERAMGAVTPVDVLQIERQGQPATLVASVATAGFSGRVNATANARSFPRGQLKYTAASFTELRRLRPFHLAVGGGGIGRADVAVELGGPCTFFAIANTRFFGGGMAIAPGADPSDGELTLVVVRSVPRWELAAVLPTVFLGQHVRHPRVEVWSGPRLEVDHDQMLWADGEEVGSGPFTVSVRPRALFVAAG